MNSKSKKIVFLFGVLIILFPILLAGNTLVTNENSSKLDRQEFRDQMRKLWVDHSSLTRQFMISTVSNLPSQGEAAEHLNQNQNEIGALFALFYGEEAGDELKKLLADHTAISTTLFQAAGKADVQVFEESIMLWYDNGVQIAEFLSDLNPENWPPKETRPMLRTYLDLTLEQAVAYWNGYSSISGGAYQKVQDHAVTIADVLSEGIINRFRHRFK
ncbi:MAG TPA: hypothetical protein VFQ23_12465 [Anaerolineales bacterium]|nr:hypothetical protein [Anaerolineales bacterium]